MCGEFPRRAALVAETTRIDLRGRSIAERHDFALLQHAQGLTCIVIGICADLVNNVPPRRFRRPMRSAAHERTADGRISSLSRSVSGSAPAQLMARDKRTLGARSLGWIHATSSFPVPVSPRRARRSAKGPPRSPQAGGLRHRSAGAEDLAEAIAPCEIATERADLRAQPLL